MGLPMVQKDTRRRSSLILGVLLALLLGVAAGFFVLAVPIRMLETVTTFTRLSKLMVQAEPPISPNDRTLLAVLAGILTAGIGWVMVDWLLFGRAGMSRLIKPREDDYEDEDGDNFRPTDPLDLVSPVSLPVQEWATPPLGDARRPLSARTDIGDPPTPFGAPPIPQPGVGQPLNPFGQILPGVGAAAPPLHPNVPPPLPAAVAGSPSAQQPVGGVWGTLDPAVPGAPLPTSWPPLDLPEPAPPLPASGMAEPAAPSAPGWLPVPGLRPDGGQTRSDADGPAATTAAVQAHEEPVAIVPMPAPAPSVLTPQPPVEIAPAPAPAPEAQFQSQPEPQPFFMPPPAPVTPPPLIFEPPAPPEPVVAVQEPVAPPAARPLPEPGFDKARLEELLARLERGLQNRRAAAAARSSAPIAAPQPVPPIVPPARVMPPAAYAAPMPESQPLAPSNAEPAPVFGTAPIHAPAPAPAAISPPLLTTPPGPGGGGATPNDGMLDQPLHVTLDLLRSMVKR